MEICREDMRLRDHTRRGLTEAVVELLVAFSRYRAYVVPGEDAPAEAVDVARGRRAVAGEHLSEERQDTLALVCVVLGRWSAAAGRRPGLQPPREFVVRFQQTCGPVMAKGVEDTAFYRWFRADLA